VKQTQITRIHHERIDVRQKTEQCHTLGRLLRLDTRRMNDVI
jgi:hypothetical protein